MEGVKKYYIDQNMSKNRKMYDLVKRLMDIVCSLCGLIILLPVFIVVSVLIKIDSAGPVLFKQNRVGKNGKIIKMYKFRSMVENAEEIKCELMDQNEMDGPMFKIKSDPRVTRVGKFIRKTSIDELPQLINILKGEMSLVGPRPSLLDEVEKFEPWMKERLTVKPGLTCIWQINGRNHIKFNEWMQMDIKYVRERCILLDIKLIIKTFSVFLGDVNAS